MSTPGRMNFERFGQAHHLVIRDAAGLRDAMDLDNALWVATGAAAEGFSCDRTFLDLIDADGNGRIMCFEVETAIVWLLRHLSDTAGITAASRTLTLEAINADEPAGQRIHRSARKMLAKLGKPDAEAITLDEVRQIKAEVEAMPVSAAGVVLPAADGEMGQFLTDIVATVGGVPHPSGAAGVSAAQLDRFLTDARALLAWEERGAIPDGQETTDIMPMGAATGAAWALVSSLGAKIEQYFAQCRAVGFDERIAARVRLSEAELGEVDFDDPAAVEAALRSGPLAAPSIDGRLNFSERINPCYEKATERLRTEVLQPVLGRDIATITAADWERIRAFFAAHERWVASKAGEAVEPLGPEKLRTYLQERFEKGVRELIARSAATALELDNIRLAEKLLLYQHLMLEFANNFVSFPNLYDPERRALFEMGSLVMDGRRFELCVKVADRKAHAAVAKTSNIFVLYVEVVARDGARQYDLAVPVTSRGKGNLCVGKRGLFTDIRGSQWDARVVEIIENPISVREAVASPFQRLGRMLTGKIESVTAQAEKKFDTSAAGALTQVEQAAKAPAEGERPPAAKASGRPSGMAVGGMLMGGGVAIAAVGSAAAYITKTLAGLWPWKLLFGVIAAVAMVMLPVAIVAILKLRRRDISSILEGSGWAINARMRLTAQQARHFTQRPRWPAGAKGVWRIPWWVYGLIILIALAVGGDVVRRHRNAVRGNQPPAIAPAQVDGNPASKPAARPVE
ncbi:MAG TPA: hypothetical protein VFJ30_16750 [Phycisphaerae bacterium]|nr:hypothetical protein [Phycisphaerae bacterium]